MNARDNIKPKSIRVAILQALSDGAITTIDDLQTKLDEPRKKVVDNAVHAANDGLIKRLRDDVTGGAAYQILPKGRELLAKYANGKVEAPADAVEMREIPAPEVSRRKSEAVAVEVLETAMPGFTAAVVAQKDEEIARLNGAIKSAQGHIETLNGTIAQLGKEKDAFVAEIDRLWGKINGLKRRPAGEMREMLRAMQYGEMTVSRGVELLEMWLAGKYSDDQLPPATPLTNDYETPVEVLAKKDVELSIWIGMAHAFGCATPEQIANRISGLDERVATFNQPLVVGYVIQRPVKPLVRFTKAISAETRAMAFARTGQKAQVFALTLVGTAVPGSEWRKA